MAGFMGDSSGAAFYSALMELLQPMFPHANLMPPHPANSYQTWDSRPLPLSLASPYALPPQHLTRHLVSVFLQHCSGLFTFIYPADLDNQVNILYSLPPNTMQEIADPSSHITSSICQLYAVLAIASAHLPGLLPTSDIDRQALVNFDSGEPDFPGMAFFARAYLLLPSLVQDASVRSITTLALVVSSRLREGVYGSQRVGVLPSVGIAPRRRVLLRRGGRPSGRVAWAAPFGRPSDTANVLVNCRARQVGCAYISGTS